MVRAMVGRGEGLVVVLVLLVAQWLKLLVAVGRGLLGELGLKTIESILVCAAIRLALANSQ